MDQDTLQGRIAVSFWAMIIFIVVSIALQVAGVVCATYVLGSILEYQLETSLALCLLVIALVLCGCVRFGSCAQTGLLKTFVYCTIVSTFISGILTMAAVCKLGLYTRQTQYYLAMTGIGGNMAAGVSLVVLIGWKPYKTDPVPPSPYDMSVQPRDVDGPPQPGDIDVVQPSVTF